MNKFMFKLDHDVFKLSGMYFSIERHGIVYYTPPIQSHGREMIKTLDWLLRTPYTLIADLLT